MDKIFPTIMIALSFGACAVYAVTGDYRHALYWLSAAVLNCTVTY